MLMGGMRELAHELSLSGVTGTWRPCCSKRRICACTLCITEARPVVWSCMRCVVCVELYEVCCMCGVV